MREEMRKLRGNRKITEIAELLGLTPQNYSMIERGKRGIKPKYFKRFELVFDEKMEKIAPDIFLNNDNTKCSEKD